MSGIVVALDAWKGESGLAISHGNDHYIIREWRKEKDSGVAKVRDTTIQIGLVENMRNIIRQNSQIGEKLSYRQLVDLLKKDYNLLTDAEAWNGGRNRRTFFRIHYFPLKILEHEGYIDYDGRGNVTRLR